MERGPVAELVERGRVDPRRPAARPVRLGAPRASSPSTSRPPASSSTRSSASTSRSATPRSTSGGRRAGRLAQRARRAPATAAGDARAARASRGRRAVDGGRRLARDPGQDVGRRARTAIPSRAHVSTTTTPTWTCSTARPSPSSATAPRATPTRSTSRTPASTSSSGCAPDSASVEQARSKGLEVTDVAEAASRGDLVMVLLPDEKHGEVWREQIRDGIAPGNTLLFGHGFSIHYGEVEPPPEVDVALIAPKGPGHLVRRQFLEGSGVPGLVAIHQDASGNALRARARLRQGHRLHARRRDRDDVQGRDRDRPVRRAGRAVRRRVRARAGRLRDARGRGLRPRAGLLRVPARAQADRRPDVREGHHRDALLDLQHGRIRRPNARQAGHHRDDAPGDEGDPRRDPVRRRSRASGSPRTAPARRTSSACARSRPATRSSARARSCAR